MDRLPALIILVALLGCDEGKHKAGAEPPSRVNAAKTGVKQAATTAAFCDVHAPSDDKATAFQWPALEGGTVPPAAKSWRWVNIWATWCKPCIEEMPRLQQWQTKLAASGTQVELAFVSVDETAEAVTAYRTQHPEVPASTRLAESAKSAEWFQQLGLEGDPPIPIHVFVSPTGRVRCARSGGVREQDFALVEKLLSE